MMEALRTWLTAVAAVVLLLSVVQLLIPEGPLRETAALIGGLILLTVLLRPVLEIDFSDARTAIPSFRAYVEQRQAELESAQTETLAELIESETAAYISDKAEELRLTLQIRVMAKVDPSGVPIPTRVEISGGRSDELSRWIEAELGIPKERQVWNEG